MGREIRSGNKGQFAGSRPKPSFPPSMKPAVSPPKLTKLENVEGETSVNVPLGGNGGGEQDRVVLSEEMEAVLRPVERVFRERGEDVYLVGGAVRDALLGNPVKDLDLCSRLRPEEVKRLVAPIAESTWDAGEAFGTVAFQCQGETVEITTFRADSYDGVTRKPTVEFGDTVEDDLTRRDLTINSVALRLSDRKIVDPHGGVNDLREGVLRTPTDPAVSFSDDPLRILRVARFATRFGFTVDEDTKTAMSEFAGELGRISKERVAAEVEKIAGFRNAWQGWELMSETGVAKVVFPEVDAAVKNRAVSGGSMSNGEVGGKRSFEVGLAEVFVEAGVSDSDAIQNRLNGLRFPKNVTKNVATVAGSLTLIDALGDSVSEKDVRTVGRFGDVVFSLVKEGSSQRSNGAGFLGVARRLEDGGENVTSMSLGVDGRWVAETLGVKPGKQVGKALKKLWDVRLEEGPVNEGRLKVKLLEWWKTENGG